VAQAKALAPVYPSIKDRISRWDADETLQFRWLPPAENEGQAKHVLEIADDAQFTQNKREVAIAAQAGAAILDGVKAGHRYWRIKSEYGDLSIQSGVEEFNLQPAGDLGLSQTFPEENAKLELSRQALRFGWDTEAQRASSSHGPVQYELELQGSDGKDVVQAKGPVSAYSWAQPKAGRYRWRVSALSGEKRVGQTAWRSFTLADGVPAQLLEPADKKEVHYWSDPTPITFKWKEDSLGARERLDYQLEIAKDAEFKEPQPIARTKESSLGSDKTKLEPGSFFWRVTVLDHAGQPIRSSEPRQLVYGPYPALKAPEVEALKIKTYNPLEDEKNPVVSWKPVADAQGYEVTILLPTRAPASGGPLIEKKDVSETRFEIQAKGLKPGRYVLQIRAIDRTRRLGEANEQTHLEVTYGETLDAPETTTQEVQ
jgi:hypothetical protein